MRARRLVSVSCCACSTLYSSSACWLPLPAAPTEAVGGAGDLEAPTVWTTLGLYQGLLLLLFALKPVAPLRLLEVVLVGRAGLKMPPPWRSRCCC